MLPADAREHWLAAAARLRGTVNGQSVTILCGPRGTGKTQLGCGLIRASCAAGKSARYGKLEDFIFELQETFSGKTSRTSSKIEREWESPHLLVLDEIHDALNSTTDFALKRLSRLVDRRYDQLRPTVLITNDQAAPAQPDSATRSSAPQSPTLEQKLGASIVRRCEEGGEVIECDWVKISDRLARGIR